MKRTGDQLRFDFETVKTAVNRWRADHAPFLTRDEAVRHILGEWLEREGYIAEAVDRRASEPHPQSCDHARSHREGAAPARATTRLDVGLPPSVKGRGAGEEIGPRPPRLSLPSGAARLVGPALARRDRRPQHPLSSLRSPRPLGDGGRPAPLVPAP